MTDNQYQFKINVTQFDSHVHFSLYIASGWNKTYVQAGPLVMRPDEFREFTERLFGQEKSVFTPNFKDEIQKLIKGGILR